MSWLTETLEIQRHLSNSYFIVMALISLFAVFLAWRTRFKYLSLNLWIVAGTIGLIWETVLFTVGSRDYDFLAVAELLYHALTEAGPGLIITVILAHYVGIIDASRFRDPERGGDAGASGSPPAGGSGEVEGEVA